PTTSNNTITGTWSPALNNTATTAYTFTPTLGQCATTAMMTIVVNQINTITSITGDYNVDENNYLQLSSNILGGVWSSSSPSIASVNNLGLVLGILQGSTTIKYSINDINGCSNFSEVIINVVNLSSDAFEKFDLIYYPNPVQNQLIISAKQPLDKLEIYSLLGQKIRIINLKNVLETFVDFSDLPPSSYVIKVNFLDKFNLIKIIKK
ncbi:T9SS type A sorting domain-containing protein, partial [Flavobacterium sp. W22_SRS_FP1]|uniref:T9SS type A sorting domain-containing protein n=1 Tax=Flavobacterium sp. W22_SRS_FP1 TaxID=3240276 RepID=UPI003F8F23C8